MPRKPKKKGYWPIPGDDSMPVGKILQVELPEVGDPRANPQYLK
jgi:hypothetical protein